MAGYRSPTASFQNHPFTEPDALARFQFANTHDSHGASSAERKLMFAVLADAVDSFQKHLFADSRRYRLQFAQVEAWIVSKDTHWVFSFENVCDVLHIDPSCLRAGLMRWRTSQEARSYRKKRLRDFSRQRRIKRTDGALV